MEDNGVKNFRNQSHHWGKKTFEKAFIIRINYFGNVKSGQTLAVSRRVLNEVRGWAMNFCISQRSYHLPFLGLASGSCGDGSPCFWCASKLPGCTISTLVFKYQGYVLI